MLSQALGVGHHPRHHLDSVQDSNQESTLDSIYQTFVSNVMQVIYQSGPVRERVPGTWPVASLAFRLHPMAFLSSLVDNLMSDIKNDLCQKQLKKADFLSDHDGAQQRQACYCDGDIPFNVGIVGRLHLYIAILQ